jgi:hypothetical protein
VQDFFNAANQANQAVRENRRKDALKHLEEAAALIKNAEPTYKDYIREAYQWMDASKADQALKAANQAIALKADAGEAFYQLGWTYSKLGNANSGFENLKKALDRRTVGPPVQPGSCGAFSTRRRTSSWPYANSSAWQTTNLETSTTSFTWDWPTGMSPIMARRPMSLARPWTFGPTICNPTCISPTHWRN